MVFNSQDNDYSIVESEYGKTQVKLLHVSKSGSVHTVQQLEVETLLTLATEKDYRVGDNSDIIATDTQKNTVYILAKTQGVETPEKFGLILANHFLKQYPWVVKAKINLQQFPWQRITDRKGQLHHHAFLSSPTDRRVATVELKRGFQPVVSAGIRDLTVLKTTKSAFENFARDEYRTLPDAKDRIFSTVVTSDWTYGSVANVDFNKAYNEAKAIILELFAGPAREGIFSPSVQNTQFLAQKQILETIPQVEKVRISMPNRHYFNVDFSRFPKVAALKTSNTGEVLHPSDNPSGLITSTLARKDIFARL